MKTKMYDELAREYAGPEPAAHSSRELFEFLQPAGLVLDLGCGSGMHTAYLRERGLRVVDLDISMVQLQRVSGDERVCGDAACLPFRDGAFDTVLCSEVLEHLSKPELCTNEVHRVLKDGGIAGYTTPCLNIPLRMLVRVYRRLAGVRLGAGEHMQVFRASDLLAMVAPPFKVVDVKYSKFTALFQYRLRVGYGLDRALSRMARIFPPLRYLAAAVFVRAKKSVGRSLSERFG
jgi:SAM-dependent methyltransferase